MVDWSAGTGAFNSLVECWKVRKQRKEWKAVEEQHVPQDVYSGVYVFKLKQGIAPDGVHYWLCASCFNNQRKSMLQGGRDNRGWRAWRCPSCEDFIRVPAHVTPEFP